jgi:hypothetical protein
VTGIPGSVDGKDVVDDVEVGVPDHLDAARRRRRGGWEDTDGEGRRCRRPEPGAVPGSGGGLSRGIETMVAKRREKKKVLSRVSAEVVEARQFVVKDEAGTVRFLVRCDEVGDPRLELRDAGGNTRVLVTADDWGPSLALLDEDGAKRCVVSVTDPSGAAGLYMCGSRQQIKIFLQGTDDSTVLGMKDEQGRLRLMISNTRRLDDLGVQSGGSEVGLYDEKNKLKVRLDTHNGLLGIQGQPGRPEGRRRRHAGKEGDPAGPAR